MPDLKHLEADTLRSGANEALRQFSIRLHEVPTKDLPACAEVLLRLADRTKPKPETKAKP
jgi:hypothetical protein